LLAVSITAPLPLRRGAAEDLQPAAVARLARLGRLWGEVRWRHPWVLTRGLDWDAPVLAAIPRVVAAEDVAGERAALSTMLAALGDPATRLVPPPLPPPPERPWAWRWIRAGLLEVDIGSGVDWSLVDGLKKEIARARGVVFDLRGQAGEEAWAASAWLDHLGPALPSREVVLPGRREVVHLGFRPQSGPSSGYRSVLQQSPAETLPAAPGERARRIAFIVDGTTPVTPLMIGLQRGGLATIVAQGSADRIAGCTRWLDLGEGLTASIRTCELTVAWRPDVRLPAGTPARRDAAWKAAVASLQSPPRRSPAAGAAAPDPVPWRADPAHAEARPPSFPLRVLAAFRLWNTIRLFFPYHDLIDASWDAVLAEHLDEFARSDTEEAYEAAVQRLAARTQDSHARVTSPRLREREGAAPGIVLLPIEGQPAVVEAEPKALTAGVRVGDVVEAVDGEPMQARLGRLRPLTAASTLQALEANALKRSLAGPDRSVAELVVRGADGSPRTVRLERRHGAPEAPEGLPWRVLEGGIGYVDLRRLDASQIDEMLAALGKAPAIVFDLRGYPRGVFWLLAPRLNTRGARVAARFGVPVVDSWGASSEWVGGASMVVHQAIAPPPGAPYAGRTVLLLDERARSQAEHTALFLRVAAGTTFVGSPTTGVSGDVTDVLLPGGVSVGFSGAAAEWPDGGQLQRRGVLPDVPARPTLRGLREGRDEVLEAALRYLQEAPRSPDAGRKGEAQP
jgi:C-terminal processing protease CtpA/Prc